MAQVTTDGRALGRNLRGALQRIQSLGMKAVLPPPEERRHVKTAIGAARSEQARKSS